MLVKLVLGAAAEKAFKKAGGINGLTEKSKKAAQRLSEHGQNIKNAINHKSVEEGAETVGTVAGDVVEVAKDAGQVTLEIANETLIDIKDGWGRAKEIFSAAKQPKAETATTADASQNSSFDLDALTAALEDPETTDAALMQLAGYLSRGYSISSDDAENLFDAVEKTGISAENKTIIQEAIIANTDDATAGQNYLHQQKPKGFGSNK